MPTAPLQGTSADVVSGRSSLGSAAVAFEHARPRLLSTAHRIVGNRFEAEDIVQDAWVRWQSCDREQVLNATAFLITTTTRLALNAAQSARARHESPVGDWTHEPADEAVDPTPRSSAPRRWRAACTCSSSG